MNDETRRERDGRVLHKAMKGYIAGLGSTLNHSENVRLGRARSTYGLVESAVVLAASAGVLYRADEKELAQECETAAWHRYADFVDAPYCGYKAAPITDLKFFPYQGRQEIVTKMRIADVCEE